jgi:predicted lipoprotein with Yx(FWY)xxD motif
VDVRAVSLGNVSLGSVLVDANGRSIYLFEADTTSQSTCSGACAQTWNPLTTTGAPTALAGVTQSLLGTTTRSDGTMQVTYNGHPLYYYGGDMHAGDVRGEGLTCFGGGWDLVSPTGAKVEKSGG